MSNEKGEKNQMVPNIKMPVNKLLNKSNTLILFTDARCHQIYK